MSATPAGRALDTPYDALEYRHPEEREAGLMEALRGLIGHARKATHTGQTTLADVDPGSIQSRADLARLPVVRKSELLAQQAAQRGLKGPRPDGHDPFGGHAAIGWRGLLRSAGARRVFQSPGPLYEPEGHAPDYWRMARALHAAGLRAGDLAHCSFSYHLTPAGAMMEGGAHALGCTTFAGGVGNTELQLAAMMDLQPQAYVGTPSFLKILLERADAESLDLSFLSKALVSGEAFPAALRELWTQRGLHAYQCYATADVGLIAYETAAREGLVLDESVILEIVRPGTNTPVPEPRPGQAPEVGEVVVTVLNPDYPLIRFGTGDLSAVLPGPCPTGRTATRIRGWMGRADQTAKVKGMFVHPQQVAEIVRRHPDVRRARLVIEGEMAEDRMTLMVEVSEALEGLSARLEQDLRDVTKLRGRVELLSVGALANDGKVIDDIRSLP